MAYSELIYYLKANLQKPSINFRWSDEDNKKLFEHINEFFPDESIDKYENILEIKRAFKEYFESVGYILFKMTNKQIRLKVFPYTIEPKESVNLGSIVDILNENEDLIEYNYKGKEDQILIKEELVEKINEFAYAIENEEINKKELIKYAIREALKLKHSDIIISKKNKIFIKIFTYKKSVPETQKNTIANRYNGIDEEELITFQNDYFSLQENKDFFYFTAKRFVDIYFKEKKITNDNYELKVFSYIQSIIIEQLSEEFNQNNDFFIGFSGYIFRIYFKEVFEHIADLILEEISHLNGYMIDFLKYYSLDIIIVDGVKYKIPSLQSDSGQHWNSVSILSVSKAYVKTKLSIDVIKKDYYNLENQISTLYIGENTPLEHNAKTLRDIQTVEISINKLKHKYDIKTDSLSASKNDAKKELLRNEIHQITEELSSFEKEKTKLIRQKIKPDILNKFSSLDRDLNILDRQFTRESKVLEQSEKAYQSIKSALVKALVAKKEHIK